MKYHPHTFAAVSILSVVALSAVHSQMSMKKADAAPRTSGLSDVPAVVRYGSININNLWVTGLELFIGL